MRFLRVLGFLLTCAAMAAAQAPTYTINIGENAFFVLMKVESGFSPEDKDSVQEGDVVLFPLAAVAEPAADKDNPRSNSERLAFFAQNYFRGSKALRVYRRGMLTGKVTPEKQAEFHCSASVGALPKGQWRTPAIATTAVRQSWQRGRRAAAAAERAAFVAAAGRYIRGKAEEDATDEQVEIKQLTVTRVKAGESPRLAGFAVFKGQKEQHGIFMVLNRNAASGVWMIELRVHEKSADLEDGKDFTGRAFVDQFDFDGDGTDEIVVEHTGYETQRFSVYKRFEGRWREVIRSPEAGC